MYVRKYTQPNPTQPQSKPSPRGPSLPPSLPQLIPIHACPQNSLQQVTQREPKKWTGWKTKGRVGKKRDIALRGIAFLWNAFPEPSQNGGKKRCVGVGGKERRNKPLFFWAYNSLPIIKHGSSLAFHIIYHHASSWSISLRPISCRQSGLWWWSSVLLWRPCLCPWCPSCPLRRRW